MAYAKTNPPLQITPGNLSGGGNALWYYVSADSAATVAGAGYFVDGCQLGLQVHDFMIVVDTVTPKTTGHRVTAIAAVSAADPRGDRAASVSAGSQIAA
jgi:hypothetical protein